MSHQSIVGDARYALLSIPPGRIQTVVTSPPYYGHRDYGDDKQIGLERTPREFVDNLVNVFAEVHKVLRDDGTCWIVIGDSYANDGKGAGNTGGFHGFLPKSARATRHHRHSGLKAKEIMGIPWQLAFAMSDAGWHWRGWIPWLKRNAMPESTNDRVSVSNEVILMFSKKPDYYFDMHAIRLPAKYGSKGSPLNSERAMQTKPDMGKGQRDDAGERNLRTSDFWFETWQGLWTEEDQLLGAVVNIVSNYQKHYAMYPPKLIEPLIAASTSSHGCCPDCWSPWERVVEKERIPTRPGAKSKVHGKARLVTGNRDPERHCTIYRTVTWAPTCRCDPKEPVPCLVLDPFAGIHTTGVVAKEQGRSSLLIELNAEYNEVGRKRVLATLPKGEFLQDPDSEDLE